MKREIKLTSDGSRTIYLPELDETYHSNHGAFNEAMHIFIEQGIRTFSPEKMISDHLPFKIKLRERTG